MPTASSPDEERYLYWSIYDFADLQRAIVPGKRHATYAPRLLKNLRMG